MACDVSPVAMFLLCTHIPCFSSHLISCSNPLLAAAASFHVWAMTILHYLNCTGRARSKEDLFGGRSRSKEKSLEQEKEDLKRADMGGKGDPRQGSDPKAAALVTLGINIGNKNLRSLPRFFTWNSSHQHWWKFWFVMIYDTVSGWV